MGEDENNHEKVIWFETLLPGVLIEVAKSGVGI